MTPTDRFQPRGGVLFGRLDERGHPRASAPLAGLGVLRRGQHDLHPGGLALRGAARRALDRLRFAGGFARLAHSCLPFCRDWRRGGVLLGGGHRRHGRIEARHVGARLLLDGRDRPRKGVTDLVSPLTGRDVGGEGLLGGGVVHFRLQVLRRTVQRMISILHTKQVQSIDMCVTNVTRPEWYGL